MSAIRNTIDIIERNEEKAILENCLNSKQPEFLAVYGRYGVGKTFLIKKYFKEKFAFYASGVRSEKKSEKLAAFQESLLAYGSKDPSTPKNWFKAFTRLKELLQSKECYRDKKTGRKVVFLDELPWMDSPRSEFKAALDYFWNTYASTQEDILLIVCGSATSWIINNITKDTGGFYNRVTNQIHLMPFHLRECHELCRRRGLDYQDEIIAKAYMVFGGVPYYWNLLLPSNSLDQEIDRLCFKQSAPLRFELQNLFRSLFSSGGCHGQIVFALAKKAAGLTRQELAKSGLPSGGKSLTKALEELEQCGFIRKFNRPGKSNDAYYQIKDSFIRFANDFLGGEKISSWTSYIDTPSYYSWQGNAFELLCLNHVEEIKRALGVSGVESNEYSFRSKKHSPGAQIDLVIDRKDCVSNLCEMKYTSEPFSIDKRYASVLENKKEAYRTETKTKNALRLTMVVSEGLVKNAYSDIVRNVVTLEDLFR